MSDTMLSDDVLADVRGLAVESAGAFARANTLRAENEELAHKLMCVCDDLELSQTHARVQDAEHRKRMRAMVEEKIDHHRAERRLRAEVEELTSENKALREACRRGMLAVETLRPALDPLTSAGCRLPDTEPDDETGFVRITFGQVRAAYRAYLATVGCLLCGAKSQHQCRGLEGVGPC